MNKNKEIADIFQRMGALLEMKDENVFRIRSYYKAAENISSLAEDAAILRQENRLSQIPGVGKTLEEKIGEYLDTGKISAYENLIREVPESLLEVMKVPSVGPKKAKLFFTQLNVIDLAGLEKAAKSGQLLDLEGIKEKTVEKILDGIKIVRQGPQRMTLGTAVSVAETIVYQLENLPDVKAIVPAGSLRRGKETIGDIDILVDSKDPAKVMDVFVKLPQVKTIQGQGETKSSILTVDNVQVDLRVVEAKSFGAALLYFTGSTNFNVKLRQIAIKKGMKVNEYGIFDAKGNNLASKTEKDCFDVLGLPFIPPELREDIGESRLFGERALAQIPHLIELSDIKGDLHAHSTYSDGHNTMAEMASAAQAKGYEYLAMTDHSQKLRIAGGVSAEDLLIKKKEIDELNKKLKNFRILYGTEVEIDRDGNLDYNEKILGEFDVVVASVHSGFNQPQDKMTARLLKACRNKFVNIIAHPTGVHLGKREPYDVDLKALSRAAKEENTFLEINACPVRLDLNSANVYFANQEGADFTINTDAHRINQLEFMRFGVAIGRRGWLRKSQVLNTFSLSEMLKKLKKNDV